MKKEQNYASPSVEEINLVVEECCITASVSEYEDPFGDIEQW